MVPINNYTEKPDMDINEMEITEDSEKIKEIARSMLNRTTGSIKTRSLVYFKNTISGRENYQVGWQELGRLGIVSLASSPSHNTRSRLTSYWP